jgi:choline dehydrogenase
MYFFFFQITVTLLKLQTDQPFTVPPEAMAEAAEIISAIANGIIFFIVTIAFKKVIGPISTGHLEFQNTNPNDNPSVTFNYFKEPEDLKRCVWRVIYYRNEIPCNTKKVD